MKGFHNLKTKFKYYASTEGLEPTVTVLETVGLPINRCALHIQGIENNLIH